MKTTTLATAVLLATTTLARAGVIFADDFNRGGTTVNTVGNGWVENESAATDARIILGVELELNGPFAVSVTQHLGSTLGLFGSYIAFDWRGLFSEPGDFLNLLWSNDGSTFNPLASYDLTNSAFTRAVVSIPDNQADLFIRFQLNVDDTEVANVDNVEVGVPEPSTLGLIGLGLLGLGAMRRRRRDS